MVILLEWSWFHSRNSEIAQHKQMERCITSHKWLQVQKSPDHVIDEREAYFIASLSCQLCKPESPGNRALPWGGADTRVDYETYPSFDNGCWSTQPTLDCVIPRQVGLGYVTTAASQSEQASTQCPSWSLLHASRFFLELLLWIPLLMGCTLSSKITPFTPSWFWPAFYYSNRNQTQGGLWQNPTFLCDKYPEDSRSRKAVSQHNEGYIWPTYSQHYDNWRKTWSILKTEARQGYPPPYFYWIYHLKS